jgi:hypothetical protein
MSLVVGPVLLMLIPGSKYKGYRPAIYLRGLFNKFAVFKPETAIFVRVRFPKTHLFKLGRMPLNWKLPWRAVFRTATAICMACNFQNRKKGETVGLSDDRRI